MYLFFERIVTSATVMDDTDATMYAAAVLAEVTHVELQADTVAVRYTMDDATDPGNNRGMILPAAGEPKLFKVEDWKRIRFCSDAGAGALNIHYIGRQT